MARVGFDPTTYNSATAEYTVGAKLYFDGTGYWYRYVKAQASIANGDVCVIGTNTVTNSQLEVVPANTASAVGTGTSERTKGVGVGTITAGNFGFILCDGLHTAIKDAANGCTAGSYLMPHATTDGNAANVTLGTNDALAFGYCLANGAAGVTTAWVDT